MGNRICLMKHDNMRMGVSPPEGTHKSGRDVQFSPWAEGGNKLFPLTVKVCWGAETDQPHAPKLRDGVSEGVCVYTEHWGASGTSS